MTKDTRFLYLSFSHATWSQNKRRLIIDSFIYMYVFFVRHNYYMMKYLSMKVFFVSYSIEFIANFFNSRKSASSPASAINAMQKSQDRPRAPQIPGSSELMTIGKSCATRSAAGWFLRSLTKSNTYDVQDKQHRGNIVFYFKTEQCSKGVGISRIL